MSAQTSLANQNYYIQDKKTFLKDNDTIVISVYATGIPIDASFFQISDHFSEYGEIVDLKLKKDCFDDSIVAFIKYAMPTYATDALLDENHVICRQQITVKACHRWFQLEEAHVSSLNNQRICNDNNLAVSTSHYVHLNDDILEEICMKMLPRNQLNFAMVSEHFRNIFIRCAKKQYKNIDMEFIAKMARRNAYNFIEIAGPIIRGLYGSLIHIEDDTFNLINYFCKKLELIDWSYVYKKDDEIIEFLEGRDNLTTLKFEFSELLDRGVAYISQMTNLTNLKLTYVYMSGEYLKNLTALKQLSILGSMVLEENHFIEMIQCMPELELLDIRLCATLTVDSYNLIAKCLPKLETFKFSCCNGRRYEVVATIAALKYLEILDAGSDQTQLFIALVHNKNEQLESLVLSFYDDERNNDIIVDYIYYICKLKSLKEIDVICPPMIYDEFLIRISALPKLENVRLQNCKFESIDAILTLIRNCTNLKKLELNGSKEIRKGFLYNAIDLLKELERTQPLIVGLWETKVKESILYKPKYLNGTCALEAIFMLMLPTHYGEFEIRAISEIRHDMSVNSDDLMELADTDDTSLSTETETEETISEVSNDNVRYHETTSTSTMT